MFTSDSSLSLAAKALLLLLLLLLLWRLANAWRRRAHLPPGPANGPALRTKLRRTPHEVFRRWSAQYHSGVVSLGILWKRIVVVNAFPAADALLNKRSAAFSDRPDRVAAYLSVRSPSPSSPSRSFPVSSFSSCDYDRGMAFISQGPRFKAMRSLYHHALNAHAMSAQTAYFERAALGFLQPLLEKPVDLFRHIHAFYTKTVLDWTLGDGAYEQADGDLARLSESIGENSTYMLATSTQLWVEIFPPLRYLPVWMVGPKTASILRRFKSELDALMERTDEHIRHSLEKGAPLSFLSRIYSQPLSPEEKNIALYASASLTTAGFHTLISLTISFFLAMLKYPDVQRKAQEEIDRVVGRTRLPSAADRAALPYTEALIMEVMRWVPPVALTSRALGQDEWYEDMLFPRGSTVVTNLWAMMRDKARFPNPDEFRPERFLVTSKVDGTVRIDADAVRYVRHVVFGFGRRVCPGRFYAEALLWTTLSGVLATTRISQPPDTPFVMPEIIDGTIIRYEEFPYVLEERFEGAAELVRAAAAEAHAGAVEEGHVNV
ncbi:cytochrome P450 [Trametes cingulata]|nr:cytochrome P450 [Trametes cingulata]